MSPRGRKRVVRKTADSSSRARCGQTSVGILHSINFNWGQSNNAPNWGPPSGVRVTMHDKRLKPQPGIGRFFHSDPQKKKIHAAFTGRQNGTPCCQCPGISRFLLSWRCSSSQLYEMHTQRGSTPAGEVDLGVTGRSHHAPASPKTTLHSFVPIHFVCGEHIRGLAFGCQGSQGYGFGSDGRDGAGTGQRLYL